MYCATCGTELRDNSCPRCHDDVAASGPDAWNLGVVAELADWHQRFLASFFDGLLFFAAVLLLSFALPSPAVVVIVFVLGFFYEVLCLARPQGQTVGNQMAGTRVRDVHTGGRLTARAALLRWFAMFGPNFVLVVIVTSHFGFIALLYNLVDLLLPLWVSTNQTIHDKIAGTVVVRVDAPRDVTKERDS